MKDVIKTKLLKICPCLCGVLYSVLVSMACTMLIEALIRFGTSNPFLIEHAVTVGMSVILLVLVALTVVFNVYVFKKIGFTIGAVMFEILFPTLTAIPLLFLWNFNVSFLEWARWIIGIFS